MAAATPHACLRPLLLHCLHSYCAECLASHTASGAVVCPQCKEPTPLPSSGALTDLPADLYRTRLAIQNSIARGQPVFCDVCEEAAEARCSVCLFLLCDVCVLSHKRAKTTKGHTVVALAELSQSLATASSPICLERPVFCSAHPASEVVSYCPVDDVALCSECSSSGQHNNHNPEIINQHFLDTKHALLMNLLEKAKNVQQIVEKAQQDGAAQRQQATLARASSLFDSLQEQVKQRGAQLQAQLAEAEAASRATLVEQIRVLQSRRDALQHWATTAQEAAANQHDAEFLSSAHVIRQRYNQIAASRAEDDNCPPVTTPQFTANDAAFRAALSQLTLVFQP